MSSAVRLPNELSDFLSLPGPQTLLIRGPPGSGKSTLCLALLEAARGERVLITNRVPAPELHREFPWLGNNGSSGIKVVDASAPDAFLVDSLKAAAGVSQMVSDSAVDRTSMEEFLLLPPAIQEAWSDIPSERPSVVIVDSWDALVEQYLGGPRLRSTLPAIDRAEVERMLLRRMSRTRAHLVLVLERREETQLDYLVNGVVVTERELTEGRLERWLRIPKLRGIRVATASYPYTVEGAKFECIEPLRQYSTIHVGRFDPEPDAVPGFLWPGSHTIAEAFGRFPIGKTTLIESDLEVPDQIVQLVMGPAMGYVMSRGGHVVLIPSTTLSADDIWNSIARSVPYGGISETLRVIDVSGQLEQNAKDTRSELLPSIIPTRSMAPPAPGTSSEDGEVSRFVRGNVRDGFPSLVVVYLGGLKALASSLKVSLTPEMIDAFPASVQKSFGSARMHLLAVGAPGATFFEPLRSLSAIHLNVRMRLGRAFFYGRKPWTGGYALAESANGGPFGLLRIV